MLLSPIFKELKAILEMMSMCMLTQCTLFLMLGGASWPRAGHAVEE